MTAWEMVVGAFRAMLRPHRAYASIPEQPQFSRTFLVAVLLGWGAVFHFFNALAGGESHPTLTITTIKYILEMLFAAGGWLLIVLGFKVVSFSLYCDFPVKVTVRFCNEETGRLWRYKVPDQPVGEWNTVMVPVDPRILHNVNGVQGWSAFKDDIQSIDWIGVAIERNIGLAAQVYAIDNFQLVGPGPEFADWMARFPDPENGEEGCNLLPGGDLDMDGQNNYGEWVAGTSAGDSQEFFEVNLESVGTACQDPNGACVTLKWKSEPGRRYIVFRSSDLTDDFVRISDELDADPPENVYEDLTALGGGPYFYRIEVKFANP